MATITEATNEFLSHKRFAVAGVSRHPSGHGGNVVYQRLRSRGYQVYAVNPNAGSVEGDPCYPDLKSIPGGVDVVVIATNPAAAESVARQCKELGITRVWMHRSFGQGSVSDAAADYCRQNGITVIAGGCPLMFGPTADFGHKCMAWMFKLTGAVPRSI